MAHGVSVRCQEKKTFRVLGPALEGRMEDAVFEAHQGK
jgi:hypothetical protein